MADEDVVVAPPSTVRSGGATVVVVAYGVNALLLDWVPATVPVVVVHNDDLLTVSSVDHPAVTHLFPGTNVGFGAGVNAALERVTTSRVVLCNPDIRANFQHWTALQSDNPRELVVVEQVDAEGRPTSVVNRYPTPAAALLTALRAGRIAPRGSRRRRWLAHLLGRWGRVHAGSLHSSFSVGSGNDRHFQLSECWPSASLVSIDTVFLKSVGGFDESYFLYWEDVDLARRLAAAASESTVRMVATPPVVHLVGGSVSDAATHIAVRHQRWRSAHRYAASQPGARWRLVTATLSIGSVLTRRGTGALFQTARAGTPRSPATAKQPRKVVVRPVVAVVHATRRASGETRRLAGWLDLLEAAGYDPEPVALLGIRSGDARQVGGRDLGQEAGSGARQYSWPGWRAFGEVVFGRGHPRDARLESPPSNETAGGDQCPRGDLCDPTGLLAGMEDTTMAADPRPGGPAQRQLPPTLVPRPFGLASDRLRHSGSGCDADRESLDSSDGDGDRGLGRRPTPRCHLDTDHRSGHGVGGVRGGDGDGTRGKPPLACPFHWIARLPPQHRRHRAPSHLHLATGEGPATGGAPGSCRSTARASCPRRGQAARSRADRASSETLLTWHPGPRWRLVPCDKPRDFR